jgi:4-alpha-glucanotransferase
MPSRPFLRALAAHVGILPSYVDQSGRTRYTPDRARVALLAGLGIDARHEAAAREALAAMRAVRAVRVLAPTRVADESAARVLTAPGALRDACAWTVEVECEDGARRRASGRHQRGDPPSIRLPALPLGYHRLRLTVSAGRGERTAEQRLIVVPPHCPTPRAALGGRRVFGILANLYTVRSARQWGVGDLSDLRGLVDWAAGVGAAFVGVNPLHALDNRGDQISPYSPVSRLYRNLLYLDVTAVPEWGELSASRRRRLAPEGMLGSLRAAERVEYESVAALKRTACAALHEVFAAHQRRRVTARGRAYASYLAAEGEALRRFATFLALQEHFEARGISDWRRWPAPYRDPASDAVRAFGAAAAGAVDRHCFVQFELERQLGTAAAAARGHGMPVGVYQDLALGSARRGSDPWAFPDLFLDRLDVGAPPDDYSPIGQNWRLPPLDPRHLAESGYDYWIRLVRAALRHAGALRIDHVMGLFRQYWIPAGEPGTHGAYMRFPSADLLGILALESERAGALVIGEDLGTVPRGLPDVLARWSILSTRVLYFERTSGDGFRASRAYLPRALVGANTHDLIPLAGFWEGIDLAVRRRVGLLRGARALAAARTARERERRALLRRLRRENVLRRGVAPSGVELRAAVHTFLARTPAVLVGLSLDDLTGEATPVNQPGVSLARYPSWQRRMRLPRESLPTDPDVARALDGLPTGPRRTKTTDEHG